MSKFNKKAMIICRKEYWIKLIRLNFHFQFLYFYILIRITISLYYFSKDKCQNMKYEMKFTQKINWKEYVRSIKGSIE